MIDLDAFDRNADQLLDRAAGTPIRVASKSVRCRELLARVLRREGFAGVLAYSLPEALWLAEGDGGGEVDDIVGRDVLVAYPSVDRAAFARLASDPAARRRIVVMADAVEHLDLAEAAMRSGRVGEDKLRVCLDVDASYRIGRLHLGARRSPLRTAADVTPLLTRLAASEHLAPAGLMFYDAQIAGVADSGRLVRDSVGADCGSVEGQRGGDLHGPSER